MVQTDDKTKTSNVNGNDTLLEVRDLQMYFPVTSGIIFQRKVNDVKAVDGEVRLWVNGEEVSGGDGISPASGYLCLESEGAPVEFRNIRLRKLASSPREEKIPTFKPNPTINLKGHPALGKWYYGGHSREITAEGIVTLREGENVVWKRRCISKTKEGFVLEGNLRHQLNGDVLNIENRYKAKRK